MSYTAGTSLRGDAYVYKVPTVPQGLLCACHGIHVANLQSSFYLHFTGEEIEVKRTNQSMRTRMQIKDYGAPQSALYSLPLCSQNS